MLRSLHLTGARLFLVVSCCHLAAACARESQAPQPETSDSPTRKPLQIEIDHPSGFYETKFRVKLGTSLNHATIFYTTNGSIPGPTNGYRYHDQIPVAHTLILRAAAYQGEAVNREIETRSYIFLADVLNQEDTPLPRTWGAREGRLTPAHYRLAGEMTDTPEKCQELVVALKSIPSIFMVTDPNDLFDPTTGIYTHPLGHGADWERLAFAEMVASDGRRRFGIDCGLRIQGGWSRRPEESPKHSFRLVFKQRYGAARLEAGLFGTKDKERFDGLILRAGNNNTWLHPSAEERQRADYLRDEWMRRSLLAMGYPAVRGAFVHLYLNGLYWGVYNLCERPEGRVEAERRSSDGRDNYDVIKAGKVESGTRRAWEKLLSLAGARLSDEGRYEAVSRAVDIPEFVDYLILNLYAGNSDWDRSSNWYAVRPRRADGQFRFFVWDGERTLEALDANTIDFDDDDSPPRLFHQLAENQTFKRLFADHAKRLLTDGGALSPGPTAERFENLAREVEKALVAESARWGTYRRDVAQFKSGPYEAYTVREHWRPEVHRLLTEYFPRRSEIVLEQFRAQGLCP